MKTTRTHSLDEKEMELVKLLMADFQSTGYEEGADVFLPSPQRIVKS